MKREEGDTEGRKRGGRRVGPEGEERGEWRWRAS